MSFLGGPECSTAGNPLAQFQKQTSADTSLQRDRLTGRQPQQFNGFRTQQGLPEDAAFADFQQQGPQFGEQLPANEAFHMEQLRREAEHIERSSRMAGNGSPWAGEFSSQSPFAPEEMSAQFQQQRQGVGAFSPQDFRQFSQAQQRTTSPPSFQSNFQSQQPGYSPMMYRRTNGMMPMFQSQPFGQQQPQQEVQGKGKGRIQELSDTDWEKQFEELSSTGTRQEADLEELDKEAEKAMEAELNQIDRPETYFENFEDIWRAIGLETNANRDMMAHGESLGHFGDEYEQWNDFDYDGMRTDRVETQPEVGNYLFEETNPFKETPNAFEEGMKIMREGGNLSLAALAFEAAVQKDDKFVDAWVALGQAQAQNEKESPAIRALEYALTVDPDSLDALMALSVSYTNEGYDSLAYRTLERWIGVKYPQLGVNIRGLGEDESTGFTERLQLHEKVTNLFLEAAQMNPSGEGVDVDVQVGLGVLFYGSEDYDKAVDCFSAALNSSQHGSLKREGEEHLLWNRLGATLANSGKSEEAIEAYSHALELRSNFVRARYNLGVSCINLGVFEEAAAHLLGALSMHRVVEAEGRQKAAELLRDGSGNDVPDSVVENILQQNQSTNLYDTLRRVFTNMGRRDLAERVGPDMDLNALRGEFDF